ncbi:MAG: DUF2095 family protein [Candidatus Thorarchaeota archaeon]
MSHKDEFAENYPALDKELKSGNTKKMKIDGVRRQPRQEGRKREQTFLPDVADYIRRCDTIEEAFEIVDYMLKRGKIDKVEAQEIKEIVKQEGLRVFGEKKEEGHYLHHGIDS